MKSMTTSWKRIGAALVACALIMHFPSPSRGAENMAEIVLTGDALSVSASDVTLGVLLGQVAKKAELIVHIDEEVRGIKVSPRFSGLPLKEGIISILEGAGLFGYLLVYKDREQTVISDLFVLKPGKDSAAGASSFSTRPSGQGGNRFEESSQPIPTPPIPPMIVQPPPPPIPPMPVPEPDQEEMSPPGSEFGDHSVDSTGGIQPPPGYSVTIPEPPPMPPITPEAP